VRRRKVPGGVTNEYHRARVNYFTNRQVRGCSRHLKRSRSLAARCLSPRLSCGSGCQSDAGRWTCSISIPPLPAASPAPASGPPVSWRRSRLASPRTGGPEAGVISQMPASGWSGAYQCLVSGDVAAASALQRCIRVVPAPDDMVRLGLRWVRVSEQARPVSCRRAHRCGCPAMRQAVRQQAVRQQAAGGC
jgi:hypothetical protein